MGADFSLHKIFIDNSNPINETEKIKDILKDQMLEEGLEITIDEKEANRSFVIIPEQRWIHLGDSAGSIDYTKKDDFYNLSVNLSKYYPIIDIHMSDSAAVHFYQYSMGNLIDKFGDRKFPFFAFSNFYEAKPFEGIIEKWKFFLINSNHIIKLRNTWEQKISNIDKEPKYANKILEETAELFGWQEPLYLTGYSHDNEGIPEKYDEFLKYYDQKFDNIEEVHFKYKPTLAEA